ncbi:MAG: sensor histidine kinase [Bacteroidia bacterium]
MRRDAEEALFVEKELAVVTLNSISDAVISADTSGTITLLNLVAEKMTGWSSHEATGHPVADVFHVLDATTRETVSIPMEAAVRNDRTEHLPSDCLLIRRDGHEIAIADSVSPIHDREGIVTGAVIVVRDESAAREMARRIRAVGDELERSNRELDDFAAIASHDLQEPLRSISNYVGLFQKQYKGKIDEEADTYLSSISRSTLRMQMLIKDMLDYSRIGHDNKVVHMDCNELVNDVLQDLAAVIKESHAQISTGPLPSINAYPELKLVFQNLLSNAIKFRTPGVSPVISVKAESRDKEWLFSVEDNGIGIEQQYYERIFVIFQRLHSQKQYAGTGIGLAHCKKIIEMHNGKINVQSVYGKGSTFSFTIPKLISR